MWQKISKILLAAMIFFSGVVLIPAVKTYAVGVDTVVKAVGGKAVVRGIAESAGMMLSPKQLDNYVSVIEKKSYDGDQKAIDFLTKANNVIDMPSTEPASKTGFKKYVLEPALWLSGLDLIFEAIDAFSDAYNTPEKQIITAGCYPTVIGEVLYNSSTSSYSKVWFDVYVSGHKYENMVGVYYTPSGDFHNDEVVFDYKLTNTTGLTPVLEISNIAVSSGTALDNVTTSVNMNSYSAGGGFKVADSFNGICPSPVTSTDIADVTNIQDTKNYFDNDTYNTNTVYNLEIEMPDNVENNYDYDNDLTVWNLPDPELELEVGGGGTTEPPVTTDPDNDDGQGDSIDVLVRVDDEIPIHEKFFLEMADMGQKVEDMYNGVVHFFDVTIDGFTTLTDGMTGFVVFLDDFFDWLPAEYVALLGSGFTLGVVSFFLRR